MPHSAEVGLRDHRRIYRALKQHNPDKPRQAMIAHMKAVRIFGDWLLLRTGERYRRALHGVCSLSLLPIQMEPTARFNLAPFGSPPGPV
ncbi:MAG: hypothetical protein DMG58_32265 [Acidobacteria bacterium]|nr:MAG: hypothetical protein DMG58_32265 [Acidobacteriota bacterium]